MDAQFVRLMNVAHAHALRGCAFVTGLAVTFLAAATVNIVMINVHLVIVEKFVDNAELVNKAKK